MQSKTDYIEGTTLQLDLWGDQFASLERRVDQAVPGARGSYRRRLIALQRKKRALKRLLREAAHGSTACDWEDVRGDLEDAVGDFRDLATEVYDDLRGA